MSSAYVPGKPNRYFPTHPFAGIPVYRNIKPVSECKLHHRLAKHEQVNVLQPILYDDPVMQRLLALNQYALVTGIPTGDAEAIELTLSAQCKAKPGLTLPFSGSRYAKLWVVEQRMQFVLRAAEQFDRLLNSSARPHVEASLHAIAEGRSVE